MPQYATGDTVTAVNLNNRFNIVTNTLNSSLNNQNADVDSGFRFIEILESLPAPGNQGRVVFNTGNNTLNFDTGISFLATALLANTQTFAGNNTFIGIDTFLDLTATTADINGGTLDGVQIGGETSTGMLFVNDSSDNADGLGSQGTDKQFLMSNGSGVNPSFEDSFGRLLPITSVSGATNSGNIAIEASKQYYVTFSIDNATNTESTLVLRFNSSSTATGYAFSGEGKTMATTSAVVTDGDDSHSGITLLANSGNFFVDNMATSGSNGFIRGNFYIDTNKIGTVFSAFVNGSFVVKDSNDVLVTAMFGGLNQENLTITDFELVTSVNVDFTVKVYELE